MHTVINVEEGVPCMVKFSKAAKLPKGSFTAMDKAYSDHKMLERLT